MFSRKAVILFLLIVFVPIRFEGAQARQSALPADLIITVPQSPDLPWQSQPHNRLVRVDADTLEISPFYTDEVAVEVRALDWSPQGDHLVVYRRYPSTNGYSFPRELCVVDAVGTLHRCMEDRPSMSSAYSDEETDYHVTWAADGQHIYFVADRKTDKKHGARVLVEADVNTGETTRTLYSDSYDFDTKTPVAFAWTSALDAVLVGVGGSSDAPLLLVLQTETETSITTFVPEHQHLADVCPQFSPHDTYFAAYLYYDLKEYDPWGLPEINSPIYHPVIFDQAGQIQASLGEPGGDKLIGFFGCPVWLSDERSFYILGGWDDAEAEISHTFIYQYFLATQQLVEYRAISNMIVSPLVLAPDQLTLATDQPYYPEVLES